MSPCYDNTKDALNNIDELSEKCYDGALRNGFYGRDGSLWENVMEDLWQEIREANEATTTEEIAEELADCIMVLLGLHEQIANEHFAIAQEDLSLGKQIRDKLKHNKTRGYLHGRKETR